MHSLAYLLGSMAILAGGYGLVRLRRRYFVAIVSGSSMEPTFHPQQRVIARKASGRQVSRGDVILIRDHHTSEPSQHSVTVRDSSTPCLIKRVAARSGEPIPPAFSLSTDLVVPAGRLLLIGDNPAASYDSRQHGYYSEGDVLGIVLNGLV